MNETTRLVMLAFVAVLFLVWFLLLLRSVSRGKDQIRGSNEADNRSYDPWYAYIGRTRIDQVAKDLLEGKYQGGALSEAITGVGRSGYRFPANSDLSYLVKDQVGWTLAHWLAKNGTRFTVSQLLAIGNPADASSRTVAQVMAEQGHKFSPAEVIALGNPRWTRGTLAHEMASQGVRFSFEEIMQLNNPKDAGSIPLAHILADYGQIFSVDEILFFEKESPIPGMPIAGLMAERGHFFTMEEITRIGNPPDRFGATTAHWMARKGYRFSVEEILQLLNPVIHYQEDNLVWDWLYMWSYNEEEEYRKGTRLLHNGATIAHIMAREGYGFSAEEIRALGDPKDAAGMTIDDWCRRVAKR